MEKGIGKTFIFNGERYMVCEHTAKNVSHCWNCAFRHVPCGILDIGECGRKYRADNKDVFFYKIVDDKENENMDEKIDLTELLKDCPLETRFYMSVLGEQVKLDSILKTETEYPIIVKTDDNNIFRLSKYGQLFAQHKHGDCILWPSEECRDWSKFKTPIKKFDYSTLKPFDKVLVRDTNTGIWKCGLFTCMSAGRMKSIFDWNQGIPYNDETKHLAGTTDMPDKKYIWWK